MTKADKYEVNWQVTRVLCKGKPLQERFLLLKKYFNFSSTFEAKERIINYLDSLLITKKMNSALILYEKSFYSSLENLDKEKEITIEDIKESLRNYSIKELVLLYSDLFKRNKAWLEKGYCHKNQNRFLNILAEHIGEDNLNGFINKASLNQLQINSFRMPNTYKFIF
jgi:hypothetical protein